MASAENSGRSVRGWDIEKPQLGMEFTNRRVFTRYTRALGAVHGGLLRQCRDTGSSVELKCKTCRGGMLNVKVLRKRDGRGGREKHPPVVIIGMDEEKPCVCPPVCLGVRSAGAAALVGCSFPSRETFTAIGNQLFSSGAPYARKDSGRFISYTCKRCPEGCLVGELKGGISNVTGKPTWLPPVRVVVATGCGSSSCRTKGPASVSRVGSGVEPAECIVCSDVAEDPVVLLCCRNKQQGCRGCLQGWVDQRPRQLQMNTLDSSWETDHSQPHVIAFDPVFPIANEQYYTCPGCRQPWTNETKFGCGGASISLKMAFDVPIGFVRDDRRGAGQESQLQHELHVYRENREGAQPRQDTAMMNIFANQVREEGTTQDRISLLRQNGYSYDESVSYLIAWEIFDDGEDD